jgi:uncharacterized protein CbrC (UPF0167 family)
VSIPTFKYHPDPIATGSISRSDAKCICCDRQRGFIYAGPVYSVKKLSECICPWCIVDGSAHAKFDAEFTDAAGVGGYSRTKKLPQSIIEEVAYRTPGFSGWQQERWLACCGDAAAFVGHAGCAELQIQFADAVESIRLDSEMGSDHWQHLFSALNKDGSPTAYIFRCLHCSKHLGYSDCT